MFSLAMCLKVTALKGVRNSFNTTLMILVFSLLTGCVTLLDATSKGPINPDPSRRSFGSYVDDKQLQTIVAVNIKKADKFLDQSHINVTSFNSIILLTGEVPTQELRKLAGETARKVTRVRQVYNELLVKPKSSFGSRTNDNWITTKLNSKLLAHRDIDSSRVKIVVEDNIVYLLGLMTQAQANKITDVVRETKGVAKVVRAIEYIED